MDGTLVANTTPIEWFWLGVTEEAGFGKSSSGNALPLTVSTNSR